MVGPSMPTILTDPGERKANAHKALWRICECPALAPYLRELLCGRDVQGYTPFMQAVCGRAYRAAIQLLDTAQRIAKELHPGDAEGCQQTLQSMIYPAGSSADDNPMYVLCCNDTCSFTWTGAEHVNQDIFECRTCGLVGSLCCCTECARICHKGHDYRVKNTSPSAYCDCWEKCKCKTLISGSQAPRYELLCRLVAETDLASHTNARGENILLFLVQTVGRQTTEQKVYRPRPRTASSVRKTVELDIEMPDHDLEPPRFARRALETLLKDWPAVSAMINTGSTVSGAEQPQSAATSTGSRLGQTGTTLLDKFVHCLLVKCSVEMLNVLLTTLIREMRAQPEAATAVARRFVRSVARIFVILSVETPPTGVKKKSSGTSTIQRCRLVFRSLLSPAVEELCQTANSLIAPVRMGVARPTAPFQLAQTGQEALQGSEELFAVEPIVATVAGGAAGAARARSPAPALQPRAAAAASSAGPSAGGSGSGGGSVLYQLSRDDQEDNDGGGSELEEQADRADREEGAGESDMELDLLAETDSDSEDNQSAQDNVSGGQQSVQTRATAGSDAALASIGLFSDDRSGSPSEAEDEEEDSEQGETDDQETELFGEDQLERRAGTGAGGAAGTGTASARVNLTPQSMQWAIRSRAQEPGSRATAGGSSLVYIDPSASRRFTTSAVPSSVQSSVPEPVTMATTASCLARAFALVVRQVADLLSVARDCGHADGSLLPLGAELLGSDWRQAQLRFGQSLSRADPTAPSAPAAGSTGPARKERGRGAGHISPITRRRGRDFLTYCLSLMRSHNGEHAEALPVIDIAALRHVALKAGPESVVDRLLDLEPADDGGDDDNSESDVTNNNPAPMETDSVTDEDSQLSAASAPAGRGRRHPFFQRSDSTLFVGAPQPDPFAGSLRPEPELGEGLGHVDRLLEAGSGLLPTADGDQPQNLSTRGAEEGRTAAESAHHRVAKEAGRRLTNGSR
ncbi:E3 ubiquitin-protein ligase hyd [Amphibalanus amphitrite]|uniref:E3 ubiquitin-protein ligase hyd n=1 Tax=Amphibalanus amphitrite TaxID=1232801 RepID=A0A6A4V6T3_AMPAM|nr:E3 ubiquitin-protein ligase hyd [Amphibalanus amphitrite]